MSHHIAFVFLIIFTIVWRKMAPVEVRAVAVPWAFAVLLMNVACGAFYWGPIRAAYAFMNYMAYVVMLDGFDSGTQRNNPAWSFFLLFWGYMTLSSFYGYYLGAALFYWSNIFLTTFCCGYFTARWVARTENGLSKLLFAMACVSCITMFLYARHGGFAALDTESDGRAGFDMDTLAEDVKSNVNYTALVMLTLIPFLVVGILRSVRIKRDKITKMLAFAALLLCGLVLVRTGARNGAVGLLPSLWYFLFSTTNRIKRRKRICLFIAVTVLFVPLVILMMRGAESIRFVHLSGTGQEWYKDKKDMITSGRVSMWQRRLETMSTGQILLGQGMTKYSYSDDANERRAGRVTAGNAHSMIMTVLYNSGIAGVMLFLLFLSISIMRGLNMGDRGRMALLFIGTWLFSGLAESWGMVGGSSALLCGFGIGLLSHRVARNSEFGERADLWTVFTREKIQHPY